MSAWSGSLAATILVLTVLAGCSSPETDATLPHPPGASPAPDPKDGQDHGGPSLTGAPTRAEAGPNGTAAPDPTDAAKPTVAPLPLLDPHAKGPFEVVREVYDFGVTLVQDPTLPTSASPAKLTYPVSVHGSVHSPKAGNGPFPLVLLMHGRHGTCAVAGFEAIGTQACPNLVVVRPVESFAGYDGLAANLASHGYVVVSVDANHVNDRDLLGDAGANARAQLALHTLDEFAAVNATGAASGAYAAVGVPGSLAELKGRIDLGRVGLMGHSRGGEGVVRAISLNAQRSDPHELKAVFALAPTDFARWPVKGVAFATLLPYCDGDVFNLQGALMYDDAREEPDSHPRHQVLAMGANHNFYNTVWTGDDWGTRADPWCNARTGQGRDTGVDQRRHGDALMASFFRTYVGGEPGFAPYWMGEAAWPASACPRAEGPCPDRLLLSTFPAQDDAIVLALDGQASSFVGFTESGTCRPNTCAGRPTYGAADQTVLEWANPATATYAVPGGAAADAAAVRAVSLRVGVPVGAEAPVRLTLTLNGDAATAVSLDGAPQLQVPPGGANGAKTMLNMVRVPLPAPTAVRQVTLSFEGSGALQVADVLLEL